MSFRSEIRSQLENLRAFRPFFPVFRVLRDALTFPVDYYLGDGRSRALPSIVNLNVTTICNLQCPFCFNLDLLGKKPGELDTKDMIALIDRLALDRVGLFLTGGEPFARKDIFDIINAAKLRGMPLGVVTNGTLLDEADVLRLRDWKLDVVVISFHGTREAHDAAVGRKGAFDKTLATLDLFRKYFPPPGPMVNYIVTEASAPHMEKFFEEIRDRDRILRRVSHLNYLTPEEARENTIYWLNHFGAAPDRVLHYQYEPSGNIIEPLLNALAKSENANVFTKPFLTRDEVKMWYGDKFDLNRRCVFIWRSTFIDSDGEVYPCQYLYLRMGNIREKSLAQIWNAEKYRRFRVLLRKGLTPACSRCCKL